jgi:PPOX class probable F420-dependent enzyme
MAASKAAALTGVRVRVPPRVCPTPTDDQEDPTMARTTLDDRDRELLQGTNFCHVATLREDGTIHNVPVWVDVDGDTVLLNSAEGRAWPANARRTGKATLTVANMENPYEYVSITGHITEDTHDGADEHIDKLAQKYLGQDTYPFRKPGEQRVMIRIAPDRVQRAGS